MSISRVVLTLFAFNLILGWDQQLIAQDCVKKRSLHQVQCERGIATACTSLGKAYEEYCIGQRNYTKAFEFNEKGCELGDAQGCVNVGVLYLNGLGVPPNKQKARALFEKACKKGLQEGCDSLDSIRGH